jgi:beta-barrel assembly-enhancing protease
MRLLALALVCWSMTAQDRPIGGGINFYSIEKEVALGASQAEELLKQTKVVGDPVVRAYVEQLGERLVAQLPEKQFDYTFTVIADHPAGFGESDGEVIALPGGSVYVPLDLIVAAQSESEFAGMVAHAIAHIAGRHYTRVLAHEQLSEMATANLPANMVAWAKESSRIGNEHFKRLYEARADSVATDLVARAGGFSNAEFARVQQIVRGLK